MKVSTKGRYALRLMVDLGVNGGEDKYISLKDISARQNISIKYLEQIVTPLHRAGLVRSVRGAQGGYRLSRKADKYTAGEILRAIEGSFAPIACLETPTCSASFSCERPDFFRSSEIRSPIVMGKTSFAGYSTIKQMSRNQPAAAEGQLTVAFDKIIFYSVIQYR